MFVHSINITPPTDSTKIQNIWTTNGNWSLAIKQDNLEQNSRRRRAYPPLRQLSRRFIFASGDQVRQWGERKAGPLGEGLFVEINSLMTQSRTRVSICQIREGELFITLDHERLWRLSFVGKIANACALNMSPPRYDNKNTAGKNVRRSTKCSSKFRAVQQRDWQAIFDRPKNQMTPKTFRGSRGLKGWSKSSPHLFIQLQLAAAAFAPRRKFPFDHRK